MRKKSNIIYQAQQQDIRLMEIEVFIHLAEYYTQRTKRLLADYLAERDHASDESHHHPQHYSPSDE